MDAHDYNTLRVLVRQQHERRLREAAMERLAHELGDSAKPRLRVRLTIGFMLKRRERPDQPRLET